VINSLLKLLNTVEIKQLKENSIQEKRRKLAESSIFITPM
jgi:hypothetical protein